MEENAPFSGSGVPAQRLRLRVLDKVREIRDVYTLHLEPLDGPLTYQAGQFLTFVFDQLNHQSVRRSYSFSSTPQIDDTLAITVKRLPNGLVSTYLTQAIQKGDILQALPPAGQFTINAQSLFQRDIVLIGGGSGITPLFSLLKYLLWAEPQSQVLLLYANTNEDSIIFRNSLNELAGDYPHAFRCLHLLSAPEAPLNELAAGFRPAHVHWGRLSNAMLEQWIGEQLRFASPDAQFFICGPEGLMLKSKMTLGYMGFAPGQVHQEVFQVKQPMRPTADQFPKSNVQMRAGGKTGCFEVTPGENILEAALRAGIEWPYSCRSGICTTCSAHCLEGKVAMFTQIGYLDTEKTKGATLPCVGYPLTPDVVLEFL